MHRRASARLVSDKCLGIIKFGCLAPSVNLSRKPRETSGCYACHSRHLVVLHRPPTVHARGKHYHNVIANTHILADEGCSNNYLATFVSTAANSTLDRTFLLPPSLFSFLKSLGFASSRLRTLKASFTLKSAFIRPTVLDPMGFIDVAFEPLLAVAYELFSCVHVCGR